MVSKDLRYIRTDKYIVKSFLQLLKTKDYDKITVNDIAQTAEINRNTFYLHYYSKEALLDSIIDGYMKKFEEYQVQILPKYSERTVELAQECMIAIFDIVYMDKDIWKILFSIHDGTMLTKRFTEGLSNFFFNINFKEHLTQRKQLDLRCCCDYVAGGIVGIVKFGLKHDEEYTPDEIKHLLLTINSGAGSVLCSYNYQVP